MILRNTLKEILKLKIYISRSLFYIKYLKNKLVKQISVLIMKRMPRTKRGKKFYARLESKTRSENYICTNLMSVYNEPEGLLIST